MSYQKLVRVLDDDGYEKYPKKGKNKLKTNSIKRYNIESRIMLSTERILLEVSLMW